jgi:hypothetical protein
LISILAVPLIEWAQGNDDPNTLRSRNKHAMRYVAAGQPAKAVPLYKQTLADCRRMFGTSDPSTLRARNNLAMCYLAAGQTAEAIPLLKRTLADSKRVLGANHPDTKAVRANLASLTDSPAEVGSH